MLTRKEDWKIIGGSKIIWYVEDLRRVREYTFPHFKYKYGVNLNNSIIIF